MQRMAALRPKGAARIDCSRCCKKIWISVRILSAEETCCPSVTQGGAPVEMNGARSSSRLPKFPKPPVATLKIVESLRGALQV
jgi:hypothetical protein